MQKHSIHTDLAPSAIGTYSQAVTAPDGTTYISGQIPLDPATMEMVEGGFDAQAHRVFANLSAIAEAAGGGLQHCLKLTVYMVDLGQFPTLNEIMAEYFDAPFPARAAVQVSALPKGALIEIDAIMAAC